MTLALLLDSQKEPVALLIKNHQIHNKFMRASFAQALGKGFTVKKFKWFSSDHHFPAPCPFHLSVSPLFLIPSFLGGQTFPCQPLCSLLSLFSQANPFLSSLTSIQSLIKQTFIKCSLCGYQPALPLRHGDGRPLNPLLGDAHGMDRDTSINKRSEFMGTRYDYSMIFLVLKLSKGLGHPGPRSHLCTCPFGLAQGKPPTCMNPASSSA